MAGTVTGREPRDKTGIPLTGDNVDSLRNRGEEDKTQRLCGGEELVIEMVDKNELRVEMVEENEKGVGGGRERTTQ